MYKLFTFLTIIILISGCATNEKQFAGNTHTDAIMDANILLVVSQDQILGLVPPPMQVDQSSIDMAMEHTAVGPAEAIIAVALINIFSSASNLSRMEKLVAPINRRTGDLDFKKELVRKLQEKCIFTTPERITVTETMPKYDEDLLKLDMDIDNDSPTIIIQAGYGFDYNYRVLIIDTAISLWLDNDDPVFRTSTSYYSPPITPFIKTYTPTFGDAALLRVGSKTAEKVHAPNVSLWTKNRANIYREYYAEGIEETANMIVSALSNEHDAQSITESKFTTFVNYHIAQFDDRGGRRNTTDEGRVLAEKNNRMLLATDNGSLSSVYNGPAIKPYKKAKTYRSYR
ncbi:MAG: hypothetical protein ABW080_03535 [Candidatus Thiodiazotropha sp.]